jgi:hypothetical protein
MGFIRMGCPCKTNLVVAMNRRLKERLKISQPFHSLGLEVKDILRDQNVAVVKIEAVHLLQNK